MGYATAGEVISRAATQCGFLSLTPAQAAVFDPWGSADANVVLMIDLLRTLGGDLTRRIKGGRIKVGTITTVGAATSYDLPADYESMLDDTAWDSTGQRRLHGPITPQAMQWYRIWNAGTQAYIPFRLQGRTIEFPVAPADDLDLTFEYVSSNWARSNGSGTSDKAYPTASDDTVMFDDETVVAGLRFYWSDAKGFDTTTLARRFDDSVAAAIEAATGARTLSLNSNRNASDRLVTVENYPATGWGTWP